MPATNLTYNEIHDAIEILANSSHITLTQLVAIYLPSRLYSVYASALNKQGYSCKFWGIPVFLGDDNEIRLQQQ
jgi:hypothetical protein